MNKAKLMVGIAVVAMGVSANAATQKFTEEELAYMLATAQIELFKAGVITPTDVLEAQIARVEKLNGECNTTTSSAICTSPRERLPNVTPSSPPCMKRTP